METYSVTSPAAPRGSTTQSAITQMSSEDFFELLVTELQHQDPFAPAQTADMIGQVSQIRSIELSNKLTNVLEQLTRQQRTSGATELLGKLVEAEVVDSDGTRTAISGVVTGVRFGADGVAVLELDTGQTVRATDVTRVTTLDPAAAPTADGQQPEPASAKSAATARSVSDRAGWLDARIRL